MFVKQINLQEALRLTAKGKEVRVLVPNGKDGDWEDMFPTTMGKMLDGCLFFRQEPAMESSELEDALQEGQNPPPPTLMEILQRLPEAPRNRPASVWVPVGNGRR